MDGFNPHIPTACPMEAFLNLSISQLELSQQEKDPIGGFYQAIFQSQKSTHRGLFRIAVFVRMLEHEFFE